MSLLKKTFSFLTNLVEIVSKSMEKQANKHRKLKNSI